MQTVGYDGSHLSTFEAPMLPLPQAKTASVAATPTKTLALMRRPPTRTHSQFRWLAVGRLAGLPVTEPQRRSPPDQP